ncbi:MAG TPA: hypothetical protein VJA25_08810 [Dehalococcoidia bacterium]|nr:hypothetical protein [Dehalococcoidia bacterium]
MRLDAMLKEVRAMIEVTDNLWQRSCPQCLNPLTKSDAAAKWHCGNCGWQE